ncbi:hypothetical protein U1Q18_003275 [Sarracenia purpurea var. burkii]
MGDQAFAQPIASRSEPSDSDRTLTGSISVSLEGGGDVVIHTALAPPSVPTSTRTFSAQSFPSSVQIVDVAKW